MQKAQGGYRAIGLFFYYFLLLASLSTGVTTAPVFGQVATRNLLKVPDCNGRFLGYINNSSPDQAPKLSSLPFTPWQKVLWYWVEICKSLPKDVKPAEDQESLKQFIEKGDRLIVQSGPTIFLSVYAGDRQTFLEGIKYWIRKLSLQQGKSQPKSIANLQDLQAALQALASPTVSYSDLKKGR